MSIERASAATRTGGSSYHELVRTVAAEGGIARRPGAGHVDLSAQMLDGAGATTLIYTLQVYAREAQMHQGQENILSKKAQVEGNRKVIQEAVERAQREAEKKSDWGGVLGTLTTVAKVAGVVAAAASVVASGGLTGPVALGLAGTLMSVMAKPAAEKLGLGETGEKALMYGGMGLSLAGGGWSALSKGASEASTAANVARTVAKGANITSGGATAASGYAAYQQGKHAGLEKEARADETAARAQQRYLMRQVDELITVLKEIDKSTTRGKQALSSAMESEAASKMAVAAGGIKG